ncbi:uncharacterized protein LOC125650709 [Ostrea edulis]|uniref:uncharacterized protein LOC125650709 n=1 Tax=Ostrea edulis TaxID=37623 RepID=UPI0020964931|nr:uncharacterized protein LOC125650709 [Ostrea edulis]XP_048735182.1 uncharacterized protein LOC125650709 [Ostrea edulis]
MATGQDVLRCDLCEIEPVQLYCDFCQVSLCKGCVGEHILDDPLKHKVVQIHQRKSTPIYPKCSSHENRACKIQCNECDHLVCSQCVSSEQHRGHTFNNLLEIFESKKEEIQKDFEELEETLSPAYDSSTREIENEIDGLDVKYEKLTTSVTEHGDEWHSEVDRVVNELKKEIDVMKRRHLELLKELLSQTKHLQSLVQQARSDALQFLDSNEVSSVVEYQSKNKELSKLPTSVEVSVPKFNPPKIDCAQLATLFGKLVPTKQEHGHTMKSLEPTSSSLVKHFLDEPKLITAIDTGYEKLHSVSCLSGEEILVGGSSKIIKCFNMKSSLLKTITPKSGSIPNGITVSLDGDLIYCDWKTRTVNKVKNGQTEVVIRLWGWIPGNLCVSSSGDLLVIMFSVDYKQSKLVRYSGSTEKQTIRYEENGKPLLSGNKERKYICENRNLNICVTDCAAQAVVVVNLDGKLRFRYTSHLFTTKASPFKPFGITTDSQSHILTSDSNNHCIHILDQNGQFLRYIDNCNLNKPRGLFVDNNDNLFVAELQSGKVKAIRYLS